MLFCCWYRCNALRLFNSKFFFIYDAIKEFSERRGLSFYLLVFGFPMTFKYHMSFSDEISKWKNSPWHKGDPINLKVIRSDKIKKLFPDTILNTILSLSNEASHEMSLWLMDGSFLEVKVIYSKRLANFILSLILSLN